MIPINHKKCGAQMAWHLGETAQNGDVFASKDYMRLDGSQPAHGEIFRETCPFCGEVITNHFDIVRDVMGDK